MLDVDALLRPYFDRLAAESAGSTLYDAHTHVGANDPDGFTQTPEQLLEALGGAGARGVVFPMHEPGGYREANDFVIGAAAASDGTVVPYCRVDPRDARRRGGHARASTRARAGIKLHPRAERFGLDEPAVRGIVALAHERRVPVLIHAGRGIPALGRAHRRAQRGVPRREADPRPRRDLRPRLAVAGDARAPEPVRRHGVVEPGRPDGAVLASRRPRRSLWASDSPYGLPVMSAVVALRCALQAGLEPRGVRSIAGGQMERLLAGEPAADAGAAAGASRAPLDPHLERVVTHLVERDGPRVRPRRPRGAARARAARVRRRRRPAVRAGVRGRARAARPLRGAQAPPPTDGRPFPPAGRFVVTALAVARTPDVALPALPDAPAPTRAEAERAPGA